MKVEKAVKTRILKRVVCYCILLTSNGIFVTMRCLIASAPKVAQNTLSHCVNVRLRLRRATRSADQRIKVYSVIYAVDGYNRVCGDVSARFFTYVSRGVGSLIYGIFSLIAANTYMGTHLRYSQGCGFDGQV